MQDRYSGDVGDYVKLALLRTLGRGRKVGVAWYLFPDESHNSDGRHTSYLQRPDRWRCLDPELFDSLAVLTFNERSVTALERCLSSAKFFAEPSTFGNEPAAERCAARSRWFAETMRALSDCGLVFADPDNGLVDDQEHRRRQKTFGKQMPLSEALALAEGRTAVIYHHNSRFKGGHDAEVNHWLAQLGQGAFAVRATAYSCRTFFVVNPDREIEARAEAFCMRWKDHKVRLHPPIA